MTDTDLELKNVTLNIKQGGKQVNILDDVSFSFPREHTVLISDARVNAVAVLDLFCRRLVPQRGQVIYRGWVSWPIGHTGPFSVAVTGMQAISHFATLYGVERSLAVDFMAAEFQGAKELNRPIYTWPRSLQNQFMLLMALVPTFDVYLIDSNIVLPEDIAFTQRFLQLLNLRIKARTVLFTARQARVVKQMCASAIIIKDGKMTRTTDIDKALKIGDKTAPRQEGAVEENFVVQDDDFLL